MLRSPITKILLGVVAVIALLGLLRYKPWQSKNAATTDETADARPQLNVGFLPVT